ncbi:YveK family protein [Paenibacillus sp. SI8]|uniref:YveK family protein n=1 Tax=unclassified Paenibacillus TaxID=185978 RepID=UPI003465E2DF
MEIDLKEYFRIVAKKWWLIASFVLIASIASSIYSFYFVQPQYAAAAKIIVNKSAERQGVQYIDSGVINASILLINTYKEIMKSPAIMDKVVERHPEFGLTSESLIRRISVGSANDSQVITLRAVDSSSARSVQIVNAVAEVFKDEIPAIMSVDNVTILNKAKDMNAAPINSNSGVTLLLSIIVALLVSVGIILLIEYTDDTIKTENDVEHYLGLSTLITISKIKSKDLSIGSANKSQRRVGESANASINS